MNYLFIYYYINLINMEKNSKFDLEEISEFKRIKNKNLNKGKEIKEVIKNFFMKIMALPKDKNVKYEIILNREKDKFNPKIKNIRNPGIDFVRIITMYSIILHHYFYYGNDFKYFPQYKRQLSLAHSIVGNHNDVFILISGIVGYKSNKYSNLIYLWLTVFFYSVGINKFSLYFDKKFYIEESDYKIYYPMISEKYWYFSSYFGMYLFLPIINKGIEHLTKFEFRLVVITTLFIFILWKGYKNPENDLFHIHNGSSVLWFLIFYLTGAYIGKYRVDYKGIKKYFYCIICIFIFAFISYLYFKIFNNEFYLIIGNYKIKIPKVLKQLLNNHNNSLLKIVQAITICLFFLQISYNKYMVKFICFFGPLIFSVYLIHNTNYFINKFMNKIFAGLPKKLTFKSLLNILLIKSFKILIFCIIIDYIRHLLFTFLKIKKILLYLETKMKEKFN